MRRCSKCTCRYPKNNVSGELRTVSVKYIFFGVKFKIELKKHWLHSSSLHRWLATNFPGETSHKILSKTSRVCCSQSKAWLNTHFTTLHILLTLLANSSWHRNTIYWDNASFGCSNILNEHIRLGSVYWLQPLYQSNHTNPHSSAKSRTDSHNLCESLRLPDDKP